MKKLTLAIVLVLIVVGAVGLLAKRKSDLAKVVPAQVLPVVVEAVDLRRQPVTLTLPAMGMVTSNLSTTLSTRISGRVLKVLKKEGDVVKKGELLATIDAGDLTAKKAGLAAKIQGLEFQIGAAEENGKAAEVSLAAARETHARTLQLLAVKGASVEESRREEAEIAGLEARLTTARNTVSSLRQEQDALTQNIKEIEALADYASITAPIAGTVSQRLIMPGDLALPGKPLFRIAAGSGLYLNLTLPETVTARSIILQGKELPLTAKNEASATGLAQFVAPLPEGIVALEGQYLNLRVVVYEGENTLVPVAGLLSVGGESFVFIEQAGQSVQTRVDIIARGSEGVVVAQELADKKILLAKPDLLLRIAAGVPVQLLSGKERAND